MDKRIQKALETESLQSLAKSSERNTALLEEVLARLDRLETSRGESPKAPSHLTVKGR
jgi:hypothetical protein